MAALTCCILDDYQGVAMAMADWGRLGGRVAVRTVREPIADPDRLVQELAGVEVLVVMRERTPLPASLLARLPALRLIVTTGMRNASIDLGAAAKQGITVMGTSMGLVPTVELTWALILNLARNVVAEAGNVRRGAWQTTMGMQLHGRTLGVAGLGRIGSEVARIGLAFGMAVQAWSPNLTAERAAAAGVAFVADKAALFAGSDVVCLHLVLSGRTRGIIGASELAVARPGTLLVNTARAGLVDTPALLDALDRGLLAGVALDTFDVEPLPADSPWRSHPKALATPHLGYVSDQNYRSAFGQAIEDIEAFLDGRAVRQIQAA